MTAVPPLLVRPLRRGYCTGEVIKRAVHGLDGAYLGQGEFRIEASPGSGFAGRVYRARPLQGIFACGEFPALAIKVLRPTSWWKESLRDGLFWCCFQTGYAPRWREAAVRCGLLWQELLQRAADCEWGLDGVTSRPLGYYWDEALTSFAELHTWVESRPSHYTVEPKLLQRLLHRSPSPDHEMNRKRAFMARLANLCRRAGATGLARQYEWYTGVSQANVLTRPRPVAGQSEFAAVDFRPGLAVPFFLPLSPVHAWLALQELRRGRLTLFDEADLTRLAAYQTASAPAVSFSPSLLHQLLSAENDYRCSLPDLWHNGWRLIRDRSRRQAVRQAQIADWDRAGWVSPAVAARLQTNGPAFWLCLVLAHLPLVGSLLLCLAANASFRQHLSWLVRSAAYRRATFEALQARDLAEWELAGRLAPAHRQALADGTPARYWREKLACSWLPACLHRLLTEPLYRQGAFRSLLQPLRLAFSGDFRRVWLAKMVQQQRQRGLLDQAQASQLLQQVCEPRLQGFLRDFGLTLALEIAAKAVYLLLALYGLSAANFWPLALALLGPVSPSGVIRALYVLAQLLAELPAITRNRDNRLLQARLLGLAAAPWRFIGNLFAPLEMFSFYRQLSLLLADYSIARLVRGVPVLGGRGQLLEYWAFLLTYNLPLSLWHTLHRKSLAAPGR